MIVPYLIGCALVYDFWRAFRSNCSDLVFAATLLGVLYVPMTSETDQRSRGEVWDEVVARCQWFLLFFSYFWCWWILWRISFSQMPLLFHLFRSLAARCVENSAHLTWHQAVMNHQRWPSTGPSCRIPLLCRWWTGKTAKRRPPPLAGPVQLTASSHRNRKDIALPRVRRCSFE